MADAKRKQGRSTARFQKEVPDNVISPLPAWRQNKAANQDMPGFRKSPTLDRIAEHGDVLTPDRYMGAEKLEGVTRDIAMRSRHQALALNEMRVHLAA